MGQVERALLTLPSRANPSTQMKSVRERERKRKAMKEMKTMSVSSCLMLPMGQRFQASDNKQTQAQED